MVDAAGVDASSPAEAEPADDEGRKNSNFARAIMPMMDAAALWQLLSGLPADSASENESVRANGDAYGLVVVFVVVV